MIVIIIIVIIIITIMFSFYLVLIISELSLLCLENPFHVVSCHPRSI
uniref:Uncharacterized protein n=1 Tax=Rhizophora mucronata TaxID=61149 RepID=A0A2P2LMR4_RHIMU